LTNFLAKVIPANPAPTITIRGRIVSGILTTATFIFLVQDKFDNKFLQIHKKGK
jgi:hypothetical protein